MMVRNDNGNEVPDSIPSYYINKTCISIMVLLLTSLQAITIISEGAGLILPGNFAPTIVRCDFFVVSDSEPAIYVSGEAGH